MKTAQILFLLAIVIFFFVNSFVFYIASITSGKHHTVKGENQRTNDTPRKWIRVIRILFRNVNQTINDSVTPKRQKYNDEYCITYNYLKAEKTFRDDGLEPVSLAIHGTAEMMSFFEAKPKNWDGPISLGLFIDFHSRKSLEYIAQLHQCDQEFREKVTVHFAFRASPFLTECPLIPVPIPEMTCSQFYQTKSQLRSAINDPFQLYPINLMRNIARKGAKSDLHFLVDADMIMSDGFAEKVKPIANKLIDGKNKKMLVVRKFETNVTTIPKNHSELLKDFEQSRVFEFHHQFFFVGHQIPDVIGWFNKSKNSNIMEWTIPYEGAQWEVQGILHRNDLYNPDYFPSRIRDMQSLIYSLCRADYTFHLLSQVFTVHEGIKKGNTMYSKVVSAYSMKHYGTRAYKRYTKEMDTMYPDSLQKCGTFSL